MAMWFDFDALEQEDEEEERPSQFEDLALFPDAGSAASRRNGMGIAVEKRRHPEVGHGNREEAALDTTPRSESGLPMCPAMAVVKDVEQSCHEPQFAMQGATEGVLYIVQYRLPSTPEEVWSHIFPASGDAVGTFVPGSPSRRYVGKGQILQYFANGICMAMQVDAARTSQPSRLELLICQKSCGKNQRAAETISTWSAAVEEPVLLRFRSVSELTRLEAGKGTLVKRSILEFEQCQKRHAPLGELIAKTIDAETAGLLKGEPFPVDYIVFNAPASASLLHASSVGDVAAMRDLLAHGAQANHVFDPEHGHGELTPLIAAVKSGSVQAVRLLLQDGRADPNIVCCQGVASLWTALDVAQGDPYQPEVAALLCKARGAPACELPTVHEAAMSYEQCGAGVADSQGFFDEQVGGGGVDGVDPKKLEAAIMDASRDLRQIWRVQPCERHAAAVRRLLAKWHPDKNPAQAKLATSVFQWLQHAVLVERRPVRGGGDHVVGSAARLLQGLEIPTQSRGEVPGKMSVMMKIAARSYAWGIMSNLLEAGESVNQVDDAGRTALFYAVRGLRSPEGVLADLERPPAAQAGVSEAGDMQFQEAVDLIGLLVGSLGADLNACDASGMTPLMEAARFGNPRACMCLLGLRADVARTSKGGLIALDVASAPMPQFLERGEAGASDMTWQAYQMGVNRDRREIAAALSSNALPSSAPGPFGVADGTRPRPALPAGPPSS